MADDMSTWVIAALAIIGLVAAVAAFLKTPRERRYRSAPPASIEEQLKDCPETAQAVIIKGNKRRALLKSAPYILAGFILVGFALWNKNTTNPECVQLLGLSTAYIWLLLFCYGLPIGFFILSLLFLGTGIKTIKTGYFPPLDSVVLRDTIAKKGTISTLRGVTLLALPVFTLFIMYLGNNAYTAIAGGKNLQQINEKLVAKCQ
jgi:hypothetical protein